MSQGESCTSSAHLGLFRKVENGGEQTRQAGRSLWSWPPVPQHRLSPSSQCFLLALVQEQACPACVLHWKWVWHKY